MAREYFPAYHSYLEVMEALTDAEKGRLFTACLVYSKTGEVPQLSGNERFVFPAFRSQIDRDNAEYAKKCATNRKNGELGGKRTGANGGERPPNAPKGKGEGKGKGKGKEEGDGGYPLPPAAKPSPDPIALLQDEFLSRINHDASPMSLDELRGYAEKMGVDVCRRAIDIALDCKKATWPYIRAILRDKLSQGVRCLADWDALESGKEGKGHGTMQAAGADAGGTFRGWRAKSALDDAD